MCLVEPTSDRMIFELIFPNMTANLIQPINTLCLTQCGMSECSAKIRDPMCEIKGSVCKVRVRQNMFARA